MITMIGTSKYLINITSAEKERLVVLWIGSHTCFPHISSMAL